MIFQRPAFIALPLVFLACSDGGLPPEYRQLEVPESRLSSAEARRSGRELFLAHCALCHGEKADGVGRRRNLSSRPADFTDPFWRQRVGPRDLYQVIREGVKGTAMPGFKALSEAEIWDLVAYISSVAEEWSPRDRSD
ncbi:MAG: cytochrome c [Acidobacteriota bacterium]|nr:cytochrome c [Acidobacteriota bacterium]